MGDGCACVKTERGPLVVRDEKTVAAFHRSFLSRFHIFFLKKKKQTINNQCKFFQRSARRIFLKYGFYWHQVVVHPN